MEEVHAEVEQRARHRLAVDQEMALRQMPAAGPHEQRGGVLAQLVVASVRAVVGDRPLDRVAQVDVALDHVAPRRRIGVLEVGHEAVGAGVERVDRHLALGRAGDLDPPLLHVAGDRRNRPVALAHVLGLGEEVERLAGGQTLTALCTRVEQFDSRVRELPLQRCHELERVGGQHLLECAVVPGRALHSFSDRCGGDHLRIGRVPWQIRVGERVEGRDYVSPPRILSAETTAEETTWSLGEYMTGAEVWKNFGLPGSPPPAIGVYENQPSPYKDKIGAVWKTCGLLLAVLVLFAVFFEVFASHKYAFYNEYRFDPRSPGEHSFVTEVFDFEGRPDDAEITIHTNLHNNWAYFNVALINNDTEHAYSFGREVSYYEGRDSDGHWSEGHANDSVVVPSIPPGHYYLRVEPEMDSKATPMAYQIWVRRGVPVGAFFWIAAVLLILPAIVISWRSMKFEGQRWSESDYAGSSVSVSLGDE